MPQHAHTGLLPTPAVTLTTLPADLKLTILEAVADTDLDGLVNFASVDGDFLAVLPAIEHRLLLQALQKLVALLGGEGARAKAPIACITKLPAELKLIILEATAESSVRSLYALAATSKCFQTLFNSNKHALSMKALKSGLGKQEYRWALCVARLLEFYNGYEPSVNPPIDCFKRIVEGVLSDDKPDANSFRLCKDGHETAKLAFRISRYARQHAESFEAFSRAGEEDDSDSEPYPFLEETYYQIFSHFVTVNSRDENPLMDAGMTELVCTLLELDEEPILTHPFASDDRHIWDISHSNPETQTRFESDLDEVEREIWEQIVLDENNLPSMLLLRLWLDYLQDGDVALMNKEIDLFLKHVDEVREILEQDRISDEAAERKN